MSKREERRNAGLCISCGDPAMPDDSLNNAAYLSLSEGRMVPGAWERTDRYPDPVKMLGLPVARLSTWAYCGPCNERIYEKRDKTLQAKRDLECQRPQDHCYWHDSRHQRGKYFRQDAGPGRPWDICPDCRTIIRRDRKSGVTLDTGICLMCGELMPDARPQKITCTKRCRQRLSRIMREK